MPNWKIVIPVYFTLLFLIRYYDFFYLYQPVRPVGMGGGYEPTFISFTLYNYALKVLFYVFKFLAIAVILTGGIFLEGNKNKTEMVSIKDLLLLAALTEFVFLTAEVTKIVYLTFILPNYTIDDYENFFPLSLFSLLGIDRSSNFAYLFQSLNLFELIYIISLIYGLKKLQYPDDMKAVPVTLFSYGSMLLIWILLVTYFTI